MLLDLLGLSVAMILDYWASCWYNMVVGGLGNKVLC